MRKQMRSLALFACISAMSAVGVQMAAAETAAPPDRPMKKCDQQRHRHEGRKGHHFLQKLARELGLNDQQKSQAKAILEKSRAENKPIMTAMMTERHRMKELMLEGKADEAAVRAQSARIAAAQADLAVQRAKETRQLLALLTPEQTAKLKTLLDKRQERFRHFMSDDEPNLQ